MVEEGLLFIYSFVHSHFRSIIRGGECVRVNVSKFFDGGFGIPKFQDATEIVVKENEELSKC